MKNHSNIIQYCLSCFLCLAGQLLFGQSFTEVPNSTSNLKNVSSNSISAIFADINGDLLDDIVYYDAIQSKVVVNYQLDNHSFYTKSVLFNTDYNVFSMMSGNFDGAKLNSLLIGDEKQIFHLTPNNDFSFIQNRISTGDIFTQNISLGDVNGDHKVDVFACHDLSYNLLFKSNGNNTFEEDRETFAQNPAYVNGGNYGSTLVDFDDDGDLDLYVAKCKAMVTSFSAPERINLLYIADGFGHFNESTNARGLNDGAQSWTGSFADFDNDGDQDVIVSNHQEPDPEVIGGDRNKLYRNIGNQFALESQVNLSSVGPLQTILQDFDNNGFIDILFAGQSNVLYLNNGGFSFTKVDLGYMSVNGYPFTSCVSSDFDRNGTIDIYTKYFYKSWY